MRSFEAFAKFKEYLGIWTHMNSALARNLVAHDYWFHANFPPTLIGLFSALVMKEKIANLRDA